MREKKKEKKKRHYDSKIEMLMLVGILHIH